MLKLYQIGTKVYQYEEGTQPPHAVEVVRERPAEKKAKKPANKARAVKNK